MDEELNERHPIVNLMGDTPGTRALSVLIRSKGRHAYSWYELLSEVGATEQDEVEDVLEYLNDNFFRLGVLEEPMPGVIRLNMRSPIAKDLVELDEVSAAKLHEGSYFSEVVDKWDRVSANP